jgi:hypothetical protein
LDINFATSALWLSLREVKEEGSKNTLKIFLNGILSRVELTNAYVSCGEWPPEEYVPKLELKGELADILSELRKLDIADQIAKAVIMWIAESLKNYAEKEAKKIGVDHPVGKHLDDVIKDLKDEIISRIAKESAFTIETIEEVWAKAQRNEDLGTPLFSEPTEGDSRSAADAASINDSIPAKAASSNLVEPKAEVQTSPKIESSTPDSKDSSDSEGSQPHDSDSSWDPGNWAWPTD